MFLSTLDRCTKHGEEVHERVLSCMTAGLQARLPRFSGDATCLTLFLTGRMICVRVTPLCVVSSLRAVARPVLSLACRPALTTEAVSWGMFVKFNTAAL